MPASGQPIGSERNKPEQTVTSPAIALPKGGGAIRGIGEKFASNPVTGTGSLTVPLPTSPGRGGFQPSLSLSYDSGSGNGPFGFGWSLSLPCITRKTDKGLPKYKESDIFLLSGAEDLVPHLTLDNFGNWTQTAAEHNGYLITRYRPRIEGLFARIERWTRQTDGDTHWRSISRDNVATVYGKDSQSRIMDPNDNSRVFSWLISETYDDKGNAIRYDYLSEDSSNIDLALHRERNRSDATRAANRYLKRVLYGNKTPREADEDLAQRTDWMFELVFDYGEGHWEKIQSLDEWGEQEIVKARVAGSGLWPTRKDAFSSYRAGFEVRTYRLCQRILMFHHFPDKLGVSDYLIRCLELAYLEEPIASFLNSVKQSGCTRRQDDSYLKKSLPAVEFEYSQAEIQDEVYEADSKSLENLPAGLDGGDYEWVDLDGEGVSGVLLRTEQGWYYKRNYSPISDLVGGGIASPSACLGASELVADLPTGASGNASSLQFVDLAGDGRPDVAKLEEPVSGFHERTLQGKWDAFVPFTSVPNVQWKDPNLRLVDLTGEGHADILITDDEVLTWYPSLAEDGFDASAAVSLPLDEEDGPRLVFADGTDAVYLADLSGDGLTDVVRIRNGEVCYWPNLGYGQFGKKITMDNGPLFDTPDLFDQKRIRLADIDGSGTTDILYLKNDRIDVYRNQCGNAWADGQPLASFPAVDDLSSVQVVDLLGNGTACIVWSSPLESDRGRQMRYIDLMGGQKPHLLIRMINNLGAETCVQYAPSTRFYLQDKLDGKPWITRLPFPVHVVERVETYDWISRNRFVSRYAYHHGYFDGPEREFRGFGMVEQWDTEEYAALSATDDFPNGDNIDESSHVPPILTRTWFHTGAYEEGESISHQYADEYYSEPDLSEEEIEANLLSDTLLPEGLNATETREAVRSLRGAILRQEVYAVDGTDKRMHPYSVSERNYSVRCLQPVGDNPHAVFFTYPREQIDFQYERNPTDPRIAHSLTLNVDDFGNVLKSVAIGYGRRSADSALATEDQPAQITTLVTVTEKDYTNSIDEEDAYRTPLPAETRAFEITGLTPQNAQRFEFDEIYEALRTASEIAYEESPDGSPQKRLIAKARTFYRADDLSAALPLGDLKSRALPYETYNLAFTPGLIAQAYASKSVDTSLMQEGGYVDLDGDSHWWVPSGLSFFSTDDDASAAEELAEAEAHFFLPRRFVDAFGAVTVVDYDSYDLLIEKTTDPVGNVTAATNDYRVLQPFLVTDPNGNRATVAFDALGFIVGSAVMGKKTEVLGDSLDDFDSDPEPATIVDYFTNPLSDPAILLQSATTRSIYDLFAYYRTRSTDAAQPAAISTIVRETHVSDLAAGQESKIQVSLAYSDGFGREIQKKMQAEPGPLEEGGADINPRWVGTGWTIFNNKGNPIRKYEPFFSNTHTFEFAHVTGVSPILLYDPPQRVIGTIQPNHAWEKTRFDPWQQITWDANDTVLIEDPGQDEDIGSLVQRLEQSDYLTTWYAERLAGGLGEDEEAAAAKAAAHADTPTTAYFDTLGRLFLSIADNATEGKYATRTQLDIRGLPLFITDARGNRVMAYTYDLLKRRIYSSSMDAGERWTLPNAANNSIRAWDGREQVFRTIYDEIQRPTHLFVTRGTSVEVLVERSLFGETHSDANELNLLNLRGKIYQQYDGSGVATNEAFDFKGNVLRTSRRLAVEYKTTVDWSVLADIDAAADAGSAAETFLEEEVFAQSTAYDALNRVISQMLPDNTEIQSTYNEANLLEQVKARLRGGKEWTTFVEDLDYNAKGQRERIKYRNGVVTEYEYDKLTFRLTRLITTRSSEGDLQNLNYTFDPVGNITNIHDESQEIIYYNGEEVTPVSEYAYDAIYRLIEARGREHIGQTTQVDQNDPPMQDKLHPNDAMAMRAYVEKYEYDEVGNIFQMRHTATDANWTRYYEYETTNNCLRSTSLPGDDPLGPYSAKYPHDEHGNMTSMPHLAAIEWDYKDRMSSADLGGGGKVYFVYDASGQRVRKVYEHGTVEERIYLGGFETYRGWQDDKLALERETVHVMDDKKRIALVETTTTDDTGSISSPTPLTRYQFGNHLGSVCLEVDDAKQVITYEEYHPYGTTAYHATSGTTEVSDRRYRYTGKERDEETSLYNYGARYYACWLAKWTSTDPIRLKGGVNFYSYCLGNPVRLLDRGGMSASDPIEMDLYSDAAKSVIGTMVSHGLLPSDPDAQRAQLALLASDGIIRIQIGDQNIKLTNADRGALAAGNEPLSPRTVAAMQLVGGIGEGIGAAGAMTSPSGVSQIGGVVLGYKAVDDIAAGIRGLQTGEYQRTVVSAAGERVALDLGATPEQAAMAGAVTDAAVSMGASVAAGAVPRALAKGSATSSPETAGRLSPVGGGELSPPPPTGQLSIPKTPPTPKDLALELKAAAPPNLPQTINVINTEGGPTIVTTGGVPLTKEQLAIADFRELVIGDFAKGFDAEPMGLYTAGRLGVVPTKGYSTNIMCSHCQWQVPDLANQGGYNFILSQDERSYCFVKR